MFGYDKQTPFPSLYTLVPTIGAGLIILFATQKTLVGGLLGSKLLVGVGLISYSLYLWHQPLFAFAKHLDLDLPSKFLMTLLAGVAVVLAYLSWKFIETPFRNKSLFSRKQIFKYGAAGSALFISIGLLGNITNGFLFRFETNDRYLAALHVGEAGKYVQKRFNELSMRPFDLNDNRLKVLVIGDSYGQDLVNALYESDFKNDLFQLQIGTAIIVLF